jgi:hypothetical protein
MRRMGLLTEAIAAVISAPTHAAQPISEQDGL